MPSLIAQSIFMIFSQFLIAIDRRKELLIFEGIGFLVNLILNLIFIPRYGYLAAASNTTIASYLTLLFAVYSIEKYVKFNLLNGFSKPFLASLSMGIFIWAFHQLNIVLLVIIGGLLYLTLLFLIRDPLTSKIFRIILAR
jgi:O-antigen/teichoic acid export membrane protein